MKKKRCWCYKCSPLITSLNLAKFGTQESQDPECQGVDPLNANAINSTVLEKTCPFLFVTCSFNCQSKSRLKPEAETQRPRHVRPNKSAVPSPGKALILVNSQFNKQDLAPLINFSTLKLSNLPNSAGDRFVSEKVVILMFSMDHFLSGRDPTNYINK